MVTLLWALSVGMAGQPLRAQEPVDTAMARRIREEATQRSRVMEYAFQLTDVRGPRALVTLDAGGAPLAGGPDELREAADPRRRSEAAAPLVVTTSGSVAVIAHADGT